MANGAGQCPLLELPVECVLLVLEHLDAISLAQLERTCKAWHQLLLHSEPGRSVWQAQCERILGSSEAVQRRCGGAWREQALLSSMKRRDAILVVVGDGAVGKTSLCYRWLANDFDINYLPTNVAWYGDRLSCVRLVRPSAEAVDMAMRMLSEKQPQRNASSRSREDVARARRLADSLVGRPLVVEVRDTCGGEDYDRLRVLSYIGCDTWLVLCSRTSPPSLENVYAKWLPEAQHFLDHKDTSAAGSAAAERYSVFVAMTKSDLPLSERFEKIAWNYSVSKEAFTKADATALARDVALRTPMECEVPLIAVSAKTGVHAELLLEVMAASRWLARAGFRAPLRKRKCDLQ